MIRRNRRVHQSRCRLGFRKATVGAKRRPASRSGGRWWVWIRALGIVGILFVAVAGYRQVQPVLAEWTMIRSVVIVGLDHIRREEILARLALPETASLVTVNGTELRERVEGHPWVASASIGRVLPDVLSITVEERTPAALVQGQGKTWLVDAEGHVLPGAPDSWMSTLPALQGLSASLLLKGDPASQEKVKQGIRVARLLTAEFKLPVVVTFKGSGIMTVRADALEFTFSDSVADQWRRYLALASRVRPDFDTEAMNIDLRYPGKVIVRPRG